MGNRSSHDFTKSHSESNIGKRKYNSKQRPVSFAAPGQKTKSTSQGNLTTQDQTDNNGTSVTAQKTVQSRTTSTLPSNRSLHSQKSEPILRRPESQPPKGVSNGKKYDHTYLQDDCKKLFKAHDKSHAQALIDDVDPDDKSAATLDRKLIALKNQRKKLNDDGNCAEDENMTLKKSRKSKKAPGAPEATQREKIPRSKIEEAKTTKSPAKLKKKAAPAPPPPAPPAPPSHPPQMQYDDTTLQQNGKLVQTTSKAQGKVNSNNNNGDAAAIEGDSKVDCEIRSEKISSEESRLPENETAVAAEQIISIKLSDDAGNENNSQESQQNVMSESTTVPDNTKNNAPEGPEKQDENGSKPQDYSVRLTIKDENAKETECATEMPKDDSNVVEDCTSKRQDPDIDKAGNILKIYINKQSQVDSDSDSTTNTPDPHTDVQENPSSGASVDSEKDDEEDVNDVVHNHVGGEGIENHGDLSQHHLPELLVSRHQENNENNKNDDKESINDADSVTTEGSVSREDDLSKSQTGIPERGIIEEDHAVQQLTIDVRDPNEVRNNTTDPTNEDERTSKQLDSHETASDSHDSGHDEPELLSNNTASNLTSPALSSDSHAEVTKNSEDDTNRTLHVDKSEKQQSQGDDNIDEFNVLNQKMIELPLPDSNEVNSQQIGAVHITTENDQVTDNESANEKSLGNTQEEPVKIREDSSSTQQTTDTSVRYRAVPARVVSHKEFVNEQDDKQETSGYQMSQVRKRSSIELMAPKGYTSAQPRYRPISKVILDPDGQGHV